MLLATKTIFIVVLFILAASEAAAGEFDDIDAFVEAKEHSREAKIQQTIQKCCPFQTNGNGEVQPIFCCRQQLFSSQWPPLLECIQEERMDEEKIVKAIRCAQKNFHGHRAADVCKVECCELFSNNDPPAETVCSRHCTEKMKAVDMTQHKLLHALRKCRRLGPLQFTAFKKCISFKQIAADGADQSDSPMIAAAADEDGGPCAETAESFFNE